MVTISASMAAETITARAPSFGLVKNAGAMFIAFGCAAFIDVADIENGLGRSQSRLCEQPVFLHVLRLRPSRGLSGPQQFQSLAQHGCTCLRLLVALLPFLDKIGDSLLKALKVHAPNLHFPCFL